MRPLDLKELLELDLDRMNPEGLRTRLNELLDLAPNPAIADALNKAQRQRENRLRWDTYTRRRRAPQSAPYRFTHQQLVKLAALCPPETVGHRVSDFSKWVLSLYWPRRDKSALTYGKQIERDIARWTPVPSNRDWELIYRDPLEVKPTPLQISGLTINGQPMVGAPDLVLRHRRNGEVLIVERKGSRRDLPSDGWPNAKAQLWAYAQIDDWKNAPRVLLAQEVWGDYGSSARVQLRQVLVWEARDEEFHRQNAELFDLYRRSAPTAQTSSQGA